MANPSSIQMDLFEGILYPEFIYGEKIRLLEEKQETLRRGLFKRWDEQQKMIRALSESISNIIKILEKE